MEKPQALRLLPLIRLVSQPVLFVLLLLPIGPNLVTGLSLASGLAASVTLYLFSEESAVWAALLLIISYILDNCDGEIARRKNLASKLGHRFDSFSDWIVHAIFFLALGFVVSRSGEVSWWLWMGSAAAVGSTINYFIGVIFESRDREAVASRQAGITMPKGTYEWFLFGFRELARADFCFLVLVLATFNLHWALLPAAAIGAQVYWLTQFHAVARRFRV